MNYRWPTDPPGKTPSHTISWEQHQRNLTFEKTKAKPGEVKISTPGGFIPVSEWDFGYGKGVLGPNGVPPTGPAPTNESGAPAVPAFDPNAPLPIDPAYDEEVGGLERKRDTTLAGLTGERTRGLAEYGFTEDPTNGALAFDPNNPFAKAALLKKSYDVGRASAGQSMASRGQLYSGAYQNQQDLINRNQLQGEDALQKSLAAFLAQNTQGRTNAQTDFEIALGQAKGARTDRALLNPLYNPLIGGDTDAASGTDAAAPTTSAPTPKSTPKPKAKPLTIKAGPKVKATKQTTVSRKRKGRTVTYTTSVKGP